jgi:N-acetylglucosamine-6-sulfatase
MESLSPIARAKTLLLCAALFLLVAGPISCGGPHSQQHPNILLILTDDQERSTLQHMPEVQNRLVDEGRTMDEMVSTYPLCCPARTTIQRGQYAHNHRVYGNSAPRGGWPRFSKLGLQNSTVAMWLQEAGYRTALFGKYLNEYDGTGVPLGWNRWYAQHGAFNGKEQINDQGKIRDVHGHIDTLLKDEALGWIKDATSSNEPFFAWVGFNAPHSSSGYSPQYADMFPNARLPRTPNFNEKDVSDKPEWIQRTEPLTEDEINHLDRFYKRQLRSLQTVDRFVAELNDALSAAGELENTYVFYYTDNGLHLGNHRLGYGKLTPYEEDINFPLIVRGPKIPAGTTSDALVGDHDLAPTLALLGGASYPGWVDGRDAMPVLSGPKPDNWRTAIFVQRWRPGDKPPSNPTVQPAFDAVRTKRYTYAEYKTGEKELYDLRKDPYELQSLDETAGQILLASLHGRVEALKDCSGEECRAAENRAP